ncbi:DUF1707 domain-containing protein [Nocardia sp. NPDC005978]|uniref:DUF1707 SHOCT-like domain-containing protein n=1 Tax=Nocardia sp. NPDC005978 TaxID=3156725 RepID=UPI0033B1D2C6
MVSQHSGLRVRDSDRVDACSLLDSARAAGELSESEHTQRTAAAMRARTFGDLDALISDLQIPRNLVDAPLIRPERRLPRRRWIAAAGTVAVAALLGSFFGWVSEPDPPRTARTDGTTGQGFGSFLAAYRAEYGDSPVDDVTLYPDYVRVDRPIEGNRSEDLTYRDGRFGNSSTGSRSGSTESFQLTDIDVRAIAAILAGAPQTLRVPGGAISHVSIHRSPGATDQSPVVTVYVTDGTQQGHMDIGFSGEPREVFPEDGK